MLSYCKESTLQGELVSIL